MRNVEELKSVLDSILDGVDDMSEEEFKAFKKGLFGALSFFCELEDMESCINEIEEGVEHGSQCFCGASGKDSAG